ncbi:hypothetical protein ACFV3Q_17915, partial [Streptomyces mexicanus]
MTKDVIALTERMPDAWSVLAGLLAGGPDLHVRSAAEGAVVQLCDAEGRPLVSIEAPLQLHVPGEARRRGGCTGGARPPTRLAPAPPPPPRPPPPTPRP